MLCWSIYIVSLDYSIYHGLVWCCESVVFINCNFPCAGSHKSQENLELAPLAAFLVNLQAGQHTREIAREGGGSTNMTSQQCCGAGVGAGGAEIIRDLEPEPK